MTDKHERHARALHNILARAQQGQDRWIYEEAYDALYGDEQRKQWRTQLLNDYARKPVRDFHQYDAFWRPNDDGVDYVIRPDHEGDSLFISRTRELQRTDELRVLVPNGRPPSVAVRQLRKIADMIEREGFREELALNPPYESNGDPWAPHELPVRPGSA